VSFAAITLCVASQRVFVVYFVIDSVRKLLDIPSYNEFVYVDLIIETLIRPYALCVVTMASPDIRFNVLCRNSIMILLFTSSTFGTIRKISGCYVSFCCKHDEIIASLR
jgi:hypothetical protein